MKKNCFLQIFAVMLLSISITGCSSDEFEGEGLYGRWRLLEVQNGPGSLGDDGQQAWKKDIPNDYTIEIKGDGTILFPEDEKNASTPSTPVKLTLVSSEETTYSNYPVLKIDEVPFGYEVTSTRLKLHYYGIYYCDHVPATFVFKRIK